LSSYINVEGLSSFKIAFLDGASDRPYQDGYPPMEICGVPSQAAEVIATYPILVAAFSGGQNEHLGFGVSSQN
jgi:hypothetical protein